MGRLNRLSKLSYEKLSHIIVEGDYRPGETLNISKLADKFHLNKTVVKEAMARLESEGLVTWEHPSFRVTRLTPEQISDIYDARMLLEPEIAYVAATKIKNSQIKELERVFLKVKKQYELRSMDLLELTILKEKFHKIIWQATENEFLEDILKKLYVKLRIMRMTALMTWGRRETELIEHERILLAIKERNGEAAKIAMRDHIMNLTSHVKEFVIPHMY